MTADASASKARLRLWLRLLKATRQIETQLRESLRLEFASTLPRFDVMAALRRADGGLRMSQISGALRVSNGNITGIVDRLAEDGLVRRETVAGDRRAMRVRLTPAGEAEFDAQAARHEAWVSAMLDGLSAQQAVTLATALEDINVTDERRPT